MDYFHLKKKKSYSFQRSFKVYVQMKSSVLKRENKNTMQQASQYDTKSVKWSGYQSVLLGSTICLCISFACFGSNDNWCNGEAKARQVPKGECFFRCQPQIIVFSLTFLTDSFVVVCSASVFVTSSCMMCYLHSNQVVQVVELLQQGTSIREEGFQEGLLCLPAQSQERGNSRRPAITPGELNWAIEGHPASSRAASAPLNKEEPEEH